MSPLIVPSRLLASCIFLMGWCAAATAVAAEPVKASATAKAHAKEHFEAGLAHLDDPEGPKYEEAYREFHAAYAELPSYRIANNIGYCAFALERDAEALQMYQLYLSKASDKDVPKAKRVQLEKDVQSLRAGLVKVSLKVQPANATLVDERFTTKGTTVVNRYPLENGSASLGIHPGNHRLTVKAEGYESESWEFDAAPGSSHLHEFALASDADEEAAENAAGARQTTRQLRARQSENHPADRASRGSSASPWLYVGAVTAGVFAAGAGTMGILALGKKSDLNTANDGTQTDHAASLRKDMRRDALIADMCLGAAIVSAGVTTYLYLSHSSNEERKTSAQSRLRLETWVAPKDARLSLTATF
jgi:hypothetical protein